MKLSEVIWENHSKHFEWSEKIYRIPGFYYDEQKYPLVVEIRKTIKSNNYTLYSASFAHLNPINTNVEPLELQMFLMHYRKESDIWTSTNSPNT